MKRVSSPAKEARIAGAFYVLSFASAIPIEALVSGRALYLAGLVPVLCFAVATLILYRIFVPVSRGLSVLAAFSNLLGLAFEAVEWQPHKINVAMAFHGIFCLLIAFLILQSIFLPRALSALMALAGLAWLITVSPQRALLPHVFAQVVGFASEGAFMLWLLAKGLNAAKWHEQSAAHPLILEKDTQNIQR